MSAVVQIHLIGQMLEDGHLHLTGRSSERDSPIRPDELASMLFAWDEESFYGSFLEMTDEELRLTPMEAFRLFTAPQSLSHIEYMLDEQMEACRNHAFAIKQALASGQFLPDLDAWKKGVAGWRLTGEKGDLLPANAHLWLTAVLEHFTSTHFGVSSAWSHVQREFPALYAIGEEIPPLLDEQDWLQSIGLLPDSTPFRTCLQIVESTYDTQEWHLKIFLQDRQQPEQLVEITSQDSWDSLPLPSAWRSYKDRYYRDVQKCVSLIPWLAAEDGSAGIHIRTLLSNEEAWRFLTEGSLRLVQSGIHVFLPAWWEQVRKAKPTLKAVMKSSHTRSPHTYFDVLHIMDFEWKLAIGTLELSEKEFRSLLSQQQKLMQINGQWIQVTPELVSQIQKTLKQTAGSGHLSFRDVLHMYLLPSMEQEEHADLDQDEEMSLSVEVELDQHLQHFISQLQEITSIPLIEQPASFQGTLRSYQLQGSSWLWFLRSLGLGACLADDMGLGKTIQFITYLLHGKERANRHRQAPSLLICPTSVIGNWQKELERFAPSLHVYIHYGNTRKHGHEFLSSIQEADLVITSYALSHLDEEELSSLTWDTICLDEAQHIKNAHTKQAQSIRRLKAAYRIALTGTPIENRLMELWSIFEFLNPGYLGSQHEFSRSFVEPIEGEQKPELISRLQRLIQPFLLRREKTDPAIQLDLPEKIEEKEYVRLTAEQAALYESTIQDMFDKLSGASAMARRGLILTTLTRLKQICDHPALIHRERNAAIDLSRSQKLERLLELVEEIREKGERCLIFTQYLQMGYLMQRVLESAGYGPVFFLHGGTSKDMRDQMIQRFQDPSLPEQERAGIFILSLRAGGIGLNLTEANHVFHIDRWWNPAVESQATDRVYRIGQQRNVNVYKFITLGTIEERIDEMMERKHLLSKKIVGTGENWITELSANELHELFMLRHEWLDGKG
ncbi:DEAD/DEAH box helicase [Brevibacillus migulae]|uniref:DEAD/DEAH box helicase n=1 Tax=Brevibacillus migulae TaxID=1644114 RepID=UPI00106EC4CA|nr:DEAD/DEAH box helicase [Brevibacillus migulae]